MNLFRITSASSPPTLVTLLLHLYCLLFATPDMLFTSAMTSPRTPSSSRGAVVSLYNSTSDYVVSLDSSTIGSVFDRDQAFLLEFYASWCGHCIQFSPFYKALSEVTRFWRPVIVVAAINCADSRNRPVCRLFNVNGFPTLRLLPARARIDHRGSEVNIRSVSNRFVVQTLAQKMMDFVDMHVGADRPSHWPNQPIPLDDGNRTEALMQIILAFSEENNDGEDSNEPGERVVAVVLEKPRANSFFAKSVALDLSRLGGAVKVFAVAVDSQNSANDSSSSNPTTLFSSFNVDADTLPVVAFLSSPDLSRANIVKLSEWQKHRDSLVQVADFEYSPSTYGGGEIDDESINVGSVSPDEGGCLP